LLLGEEGTGLVVLPGAVGLAGHAVEEHVHPGDRPRRSAKGTCSRGRGRPASSSHHREIDSNQLSASGSARSTTRSAIRSAARSRV
jgi:hypothetical protein